MNASKPDLLVVVEQPNGRKTKMDLNKAAEDLSQSGFMMEFLARKTREALLAGEVFTSSKGVTYRFDSHG